MNCKRSLKGLTQNNQKEKNEMPKGDGTGPMGMGPMTGRGIGHCAGYAAPGYAGCGRGRGRGFRRTYELTGLPGWARYGAHPYGFAPVAYQGVASAADEVDEKEVLQNQADFLENQLKGVRERLEKFEEKAE